MQTSLPYGVRTGVIARSVAGLLQALALLLAAAAFAAGQPAAAGAAAESARHAGPGATFYRVVNLAPGYTYGIPLINARGQVAFSLGSQAIPNATEPSAWFHDGGRTRPIGDLGDPAGYAIVTGLNNHGQVVGQSRLASGESRVFIWSPQRAIADLGTLPGTTHTWSPAINDRGVVAGSARGDPPRNRLFRWTAAGGMEDLVPAGADIPGEKYVRAINDDGLITGFSWDQSITHAFVWTRNTGLVDIHTIEGSSYSSPMGVSDRGEVVGNYDLDRFGGSGLGVRSFVWTRGGGLRNLDPRDLENRVEAVTANGLAVGTRAEYTAFTWTRARGLVELDKGLGLHTLAVAANRHGQVVGNADETGPPHAVLWTAGGRLVDLHSRLRRAPAGLALTGAVAISDNGTIVAYSNAGVVLLQPDRGQPVAYAVGPIAVPATATVGVPFDVSVSIADDHPGARHRIRWNWDDGATTQSTSTRVGPGQWRAGTRHSFATTGLHMVRARVVDRSGRDVVVLGEVNVQGGGPPPPG